MVEQQQAAAVEGLLSGATLCSVGDHWVDRPVAKGLTFTWCEACGERYEQISEKKGMSYADRWSESSTIAFAMFRRVELARERDRDREGQ